MAARKDDHSLTSADAIRYLKILLNRYKGEDIVVLWDGAPIHRSNKIKQFLSNADVAKLLRLVRIPPYAPEFNPQEWIWSWLKPAMGNRCCKTLWELRLAFEQAEKTGGTYNSHYSRLPHYEELLMRAVAWFAERVY